MQSLSKIKVYWPIVCIPNDVKPVGHKWVFMLKKKCDNEIMRFDVVVAEGL